MSKKDKLSNESAIVFTASGSYSPIDSPVIQVTSDKYISVLFGGKEEGIEDKVYVRYQTESLTFDYGKWVLCFYDWNEVSYDSVNGWLSFIHTDFEDEIEKKSGTTLEEIVGSYQWDDLKTVFYCGTGVNSLKRKINSIVKKLNGTIVDPELYSTITYRPGG